MSSAAPRVWHIITGEFPPVSGGVADYTALLAEGLAQRGCTVNVWCPPTDAYSSPHESITLHPLPVPLGIRGLLTLGSQLNAFHPQRTLLVQYVYNIYGYHGMNLGFCAWLIWRRIRYGDDVRIMFHEPFYPFVRQPLRLNILAVVTRIMAGLLLLAARSAYVSTTAWAPMLMRWNLLRCPIRRLPVPSTISGHPPIPSLIRTGPLVVGHFGTYGPQLRSTLLRLFARLLGECPRIQLKLLGRGASLFARELAKTVPQAEDRVEPLDQLPADSVAQQIRSCDVMLQYYPDGVSSRRTSVMACLANGAPVVTTLGFLSDPEWLDCESVRLAPADDIAAIVAAVTQLLDDPAEQARLATAGYEFYQREFALERTLQFLVSA